MQLYVLNAFPHQRFLHTPMAFRSSLTFFQCSTPFGIKGFCTSHRTVTSTASSARSAQRLSASKVSAHRGGRYEVELFHQCSTPFGIKGFCTCTPALNRGGWRNGSAQRLSASKVSALRQATASRDSHTVLNAFRHQRFLHRWRTQLRRGRFQVLNAFRHQRFLHRDYRIREHRTPNEYLCSTPFGIKGFCTWRVPACFPARDRVLNAFRHQRFLHVQGQVVYFFPSLCSTPFGIKGFCTSTLGSVAPTGGYVLNAFRHQRFLHLTPEAVGNVTVSVLNAFRHQRFLHPRPRRRDG